MHLHVVSTITEEPAAEADHEDKNVTSITPLDFNNQTQRTSCKNDMELKSTAETNVNSTAPNTNNLTQKISCESDIELMSRHVSENAIEFDSTKL